MRPSPLLLSLLVVVPTAFAAPKSDVGKIIAEISTVGEYDEMPAEFNSIVGDNQDRGTKFVEVTKGDLTRTCRLMLDSKDPEGKPAYLIVSTIVEDKKDLEFEGFVYRVDLSGTLAHVVKQEGKLTAEGEGVPGSAKEAKMDEKSPRIQKQFKKELDFWLRHIQSNKTAKRPASSPGK